MADPKPPPDPKPGSEWDWKDPEGQKKKLALCLKGAEKCTEPKPQHEEIWCLADAKCDTNDKPCQCWLFQAKKGGKEWEPMPQPKKKYPYDKDYFYACFCVRVIS